MTALTFFFVVAGLAHFAAPSFWVAFTGLCEIAGGAGLQLEATRAAAGWGLCALLVAVFPANVEMLRRQWPEASTPKRAFLVARLPLQLPLLYWVYAAALRR